jgi:outer membrane protein assembly factor BamB
MISLDKKNGQNRYSIIYLGCGKCAFAFLLTIIFVSLHALFPVLFYAQTTFPATLKKCWENTILTKNISIASDNPSSFFLLTTDSEIKSINSQNGEVNWVYETGGKNISNFIISDKSLYVAGISEITGNTIENSEEFNKPRESEQPSRQIYLRSVATMSGIPDWSSKIDLKGTFVNKNIGEADDKIYLGRNGNSVFLLGSSGNLFSAQKNKDSIELARKYDSTVREFFDLDSDSISNSNFSNLSQKLFAFYGTDKKFYLITAKTGEIIYSFFPSNIVTSATAISPGHLIIGDEKGFLSLVNVENEVKSDIVWSVKLGAGISSVSNTGNGVLVTSLDNFVYLINQTKGSRVWKKRLSGRLLYKPLIIENEKTFVVVENDSAYFISLENGAILNRITLAADDYFINTPVFINDQYIFPTNSGIVSYSDSRCLRERVNQL